MTYPYSVDIQRKSKSLQRRYSENHIWFCRTTFSFALGRDTSLKRIPTMRFWWKKTFLLCSSEGLRLSRDAGLKRSPTIDAVLMKKNFAPLLGKVFSRVFVSLGMLVSGEAGELLSSSSALASNRWSGLSCSPAPSSSTGVVSNSLGPLLLLHQVFRPPTGGLASVALLFLLQQVVSPYSFTR